MKRNIYITLLAAEAAACVIFAALQTASAPSGVFSAAMAFPFEQIGLTLRALSLTGRTGNAAAAVIYTALCLSPAAALLVLRKRRKLFPEDALLCLLSAALFAVLYLMVNPGMIGWFTGGAAAGQAAGKAVLGGAAYSVICGYLVLRALRLFMRQSDAAVLARYLAVMLGVLGAIFVFMASACFGGLLGSVTALKAANTGNEHLLGASYTFLILRFTVDALPYVLNVFVVLAALRLIEEFRADRYSAGTVAASGRVSKLCAVALAVSVLAGIGFNLLQLVFAKPLTVISVSVDIPVFSIAFVLAALLLTRFAAENKRLKDDNDAFI